MQEDVKKVSDKTTQEFTYDDILMLGNFIKEVVNLIPKPIDRLPIRTWFRDFRNEYDEGCKVFAEIHDAVCGAGVQNVPADKVEEIVKQRTEFVKKTVSISYSPFNFEWIAQIEKCPNEEILYKTNIL